MDGDRVEVGWTDNTAQLRVAPRRAPANGTSQVPSPPPQKTPSPVQCSPLGHVSSSAQIIQSLLPPTHPSLASTEPIESPSSHAGDLKRRSGNAPSPSPQPFNGIWELDPISNLCGYAATAFVPELPSSSLLKVHWDDRMEALKTEEINRGCATVLKLRGLQGGLEQRVAPRQGRRVLVEIERIHDPVVAEAAAKCECRRFPSPVPSQRVLWMAVVKAVFVAACKGRTSEVGARR
jgi:hypothetical protein